jgi:hypothetical protein
MTWKESRSIAANRFDPSVAPFEGADMAWLVTDSMEDGEESNEIHQEGSLQTRAFSHSVTLISA